MFHLLPLLLLTAANPCISDDDLSQGKPKPSPTPFQDWDYLVYSQRWPITACTEWKERNPQNICQLPQDNSTWIVHGIWPTKIGAKGPFFCNSALHFDPDQLAPMMKELQEYWPNIEANTKPNSFWKHEWNKHGTCAASLPLLNSVTNFFKQGIEWNHQYQLATILSKSNIIPDVGGYNISAIYNSIKGTTGKNPTIECVIDGRTKESYISEIRLCFNKNLELIHCNVTNPNQTFLNDDILGNCNGNKNVMYLAKVPNNTLTEVPKDAYFEFDEEASIQRCIENYNLQSKLLKLYDIIKFLMWFTL